MSDLDFAHSVVRGLSSTPRWLDCRYIYDDHGSRIFELICEQPEYYLTRIERAILLDASDEIARLTGPAAVIEFGSGNSSKTQILLNAYAHRYGGVRYIPVDISDSILERAERELATTAPLATVDSFHGSYDEAFHLLHSFSPLVFLFLGSNVGNLDAAEAADFWKKISSSLYNGDFCLLGIDITEDPDALHAAYNDEAGYSAEFTKNIFARINRELGASIDIDAIEHVARYNPGHNRVEIFGKFTAAQQIHIELLSHRVTIEENELVMTEISRKFRIDEVRPYLEGFGLETRQVFTNPEHTFAVMLLARKKT